jgi:Uma2 family endonuclease
MSTRNVNLSAAPSPAIWNAVELAERFGPIPMNRIVTQPPPGLATEEDAIELTERHDRPCELVDGILVEKVMGAYESMLAVEIAALLRNWVKPRKLGTVLGADGMLKLAPGLIRIPDVAYLSMEKFPGGRFPKGAAAALAPDIAVEVLSPSNTKQEMDEKLDDYFAAGCRLVWHFDPQKQQVEVFTGPEAGRIVTIDQVLDGGEVLPGFELNLRELFAELPPE